MEEEWDLSSFAMEFLYQTVEVFTSPGFYSLKLANKPLPDLLYFEYMVMLSH